LFSISQKGPHGIGLSLSQGKNGVPADDVHPWGQRPRLLAPAARVGEVAFSQTWQDFDLSGVAVFAAQSGERRQEVTGPLIRAA
jgi:hypothetical protein